MMRFLSGSVMRNTYKVGLMGGVPAAYVRARGSTRDGHAIGWECAENVGECGFHGLDPYPLIHGFLSRTAEGRKRLISVVKAVLSDKA